MASCSFGWHFQQAFSTVEGTFLYILRGLVMLFSLMNVYWMTMTQWKEYTLEFVDPKNSLYSPNAKKLPKIEEPRQEPAEKSEETSENTASNKAEKKTKNKFTIKPIVFERQSLRIWQPPFSAICMACSYSPLHFLLIELLTFNSESSLTSTPSSSASSSVIPSLSLVILLISLSVVLLWTSLQFYTSLKDRDILFQQVMREYNMKFVYPTLTKLSEKQALLDRLEKQKEEIQKSQVEIPEPLTEKNPFFKTPPPEELEEPEQSSTTKKKKHRKHIVEQPESTKEDRSTRAKKRTPGSQRISQRTPGSKKEPLK